MKLIGTLAVCAALLLLVSGCTAAEPEPVTPAPIDTTYSPQTVHVSVGGLAGLGARRGQFDEDARRECTAFRKREKAGSLTGALNSTPAATDKLMREPTGAGGQLLTKERNLVLALDPSEPVYLCLFSHGPRSYGSQSSASHAVIAVFDGTTTGVELGSYAVGDPDESSGIIQVVPAE